MVFFAESHFLLAKNIEWTVIWHTQRITESAFHARRDNHFEVISGSEIKSGTSNGSLFIHLQRIHTYILYSLCVDALVFTERKRASIKK